MESGRVGGPGAYSHSLFFGGAGWENGPAEARTTRRWAQLAAGGMSIGWTRGEVGTEHAEEAQGDEPLAKRVSRQNSQTMKSHPVALRFVMTDLRFQIEKVKGVKEVVGQEGEERERFHRPGVVFIHRVGVPLVDQFVESMVPDIPATMPETEGLFSRGLGRRECHRPDPLRGHRLDLLGRLALHSVNLLRADDPHRSVDLGPGGEVRHVPPPTASRAILSLLRWSDRKQAASVLVELTPLVLGDDEGMLSVGRSRLMKGAWA